MWNYLCITLHTGLKPSSFCLACYSWLFLLWWTLFPLYTYRVKGYWCHKSLPIIKCDTLLQPLITLKLWCVCADENPASLQQGVHIWSRWELCFSRGLSWWRANPLFLPRLFLEAWGLLRYFDLGDTAVEKISPNLHSGCHKSILILCFSAIWSVMSSFSCLCSC